MNPPRQPDIEKLKERVAGILTLAGELGASDADVIQVRGALEAGAQVVTEGNERVFTGDRVRIIGRYRPPK